MEFTIFHLIGLFLFFGFLWMLWYIRLFEGQKKSFKLAVIWLLSLGLYGMVIASTGIDMDSNLGRWVGFATLGIWDVWLFVYGYRKGYFGRFFG
ncbi:MAG: hypothetical protein A2351_02530 [Omnitrophica bacterium RIFOXYB12_FULL_50_7]|nr:MAG: hypothetical protein A2351_02530 [Omnitrophica bacterium RIFOXYB12_FULL_50_7]